MQLPSLPWLASTLLVYVCCRAACHDGSISHALNASIRACQRPAAPAADDIVSTKVNLKLDSPEVLLVLDPNGIICWEKVELDTFTNATLLHWLYQQNDLLTTSARDSTGTPIQASLRALTVTSVVSGSAGVCDCQTKATRGTNSTHAIGSLLLYICGCNNIMMPVLFYDVDVMHVDSKHAVQHT